MRFAVALLLPCLAAITLQAAETNLAFTVDGVTYSNVTFGTLTPLTVNIRHSAGVAKVPLARLPAELQQRFGYDPQKAADWQKAEQQRAMLAKLSKTLLTVPFKVGMVGVSRNGEITVIQVIGPNEMRAEVKTEAWGEVEDGFYPYSQAVGPQSLVKKYRRAPYSVANEVWIKGISTAGLVDGAGINRNDVFKVTGTKTYPTAVGGTATIFVLEPLASVSSP